ncbi:ArnT family glycosyltransferase [Acidicapsa acidisoli]|uniref:ArnT family glycosyltransferase n=1 Tax=Acidicapsa acidisoli TaxID=1615681 RepID=UPI0021E0268D|nr:glycosyltransferase family 39 protein [Acidicapsa acidisoli]
MTESAKYISRPAPSSSVRAVWALLLVVFGAIYLSALHTPSLLDDADASHAQAAAHMAESGDLVTLKVDGIRYLEKPPLPYWIVAGLYKVLGENAYATHLPNALAVLGCAWIAWLWCRRAWGDRAALYAALGTLTACGPFLYTRFFIPEALLSFLLLLALFCFLTGLESSRPARFYVAWVALALATLTKGLIAPVFFIAAVIPLLLLSGQWRRWRQLKPVTGILLFLLVAAPWHILAGLRNPDQGHPVGNIPTLGNVHGFWYFYFLNEHVFRFLGTRYPHDYNRLPFLAYWALPLIWTFPWSLFFPAALVVAWRTRHTWLQHLRKDAGQTVDFYLDHAVREDVASFVFRLKFRSRSTWLLGLFAAFTLIFFSLSTNQEYYTWPAWIPLIMLAAGTLAGIEEAGEDLRTQKTAGKVPGTGWILAAHWLYAAVGVIIAALLGWGLWESRKLPFVSDIGTLLAHRAFGDYTLSMSHLFDLTGPSFAALRLPAGIAAAALLLGPLTGLILRMNRRNAAATVSIGLTSAVFLVAAHIAFARFQPMLSSRQLATTILQKATPSDDFVIFGDQSDASSVIFYTHRFFGHPALVVMERCSQHGNGSSLIWGSCYPDAPNIFLTQDQLAAQWGKGPRHWLFAQDTNRSKVQQLLAGRLIPVQTIADKTLWTDRPLN